MKMFFYQKYKSDLTTYTYELLKFLALKNGNIIVDVVGDADIVLISLTSFYEIDVLRVFRNRNKNATIVVGGHCCNNPLALLKYCDFVNLGQGFSFFKECKTVLDLYNKEYIVHKNKHSGTISQYIAWDMVPVVQISKTSYSYLYSMGCRKRCQFCLTSHLNKYQVNPNKSKIKNIYKKIKGNLYLITNDFDGGIEIKRNVSDITIKEYLRNNKKQEGIKLLRLGIECVTEEKRKLFGKNITDEELKCLFQKTFERKQRMNLFFIAGVETQEQWESFVDILPICYTSAPRIGVVINYFDPQKLTKIEKGYDLTKIIPLNIPRIKRLWKLKCVRIVIFKDLALAPYNAIIDCMLSRCETDHVDSILSLKKVKKTSLEQFFEEIDKLGLIKLVDGSYTNDCNIKLR